VVAASSVRQLLSVGPHDAFYTSVMCDNTR